jgi:seryl-tRNA synthetase
LPPAPASELPKPRLDYRAIAENAVYKSHNAFTRRAPLPAGAPQAVARLYESWKGLSHELNTRRHERGALGERIRAAARDPAAKAAALAEAQALKADVAALEAQVTEAEDSMLALALALPNDTHPAVPIGPEAAAAELSSHGPAPVPASSARDHVAVGKALGMLDLEAGATVTGTSWYYLLGDGALLELALTQYALAAALRHGFRPVLAPDVVRADVAARCGFQPRDPRADAPASQMYHVAGSAPELVLAGTAEIPLAGFFANKVLPAHELPTKLVGLGRAFRAEAGARGADTRGLYRVHQFSKLELFAVCAADGDASERMFEEMRAVQTEIFAGLGLSFR